MQNVIERIYAVYCFYRWFTLVKKLSILNIDIKLMFQLLRLDLFLFLDFNSYSIIDRVFQFCH